VRVKGRSGEVLVLRDGIMKGTWYRGICDGAQRFADAVCSQCEFQLAGLNSYFAEHEWHLEHLDFFLFSQ
jgi:hypothetical protein